MTVKINTEADRISVTFPFDWGVIERIRAAGILTWNKKNRVWQCHDTPVNREALADLFPDAAGFASRQDIPARENPELPELTLNPILMEHQRKNVLTAVRKHRWLFQDDTGTGKTLTGLEIIKQIGVKTLIICKISLIRNAWMEDKQKFGYEFPVLNFWELNRRKTDREVADALGNFSVGIINYELFLRFHSRFKLTEFGIEGLILDEAAKVKSASAQTSKAVFALADTCRYVVSMTATPAPNGITDFFSQMRLIAPQKWGTSFYKWRLKYFVPSGFGGFKWTVRDEETQRKLLADVATISSCVRKEAVLDLPEGTFCVRSVSLADTERKAHKDMAKNLMLELSEDKNITAANAAVKIGKLRQITAGFLLDTADSGKPVILGDSKLRELAELLEEIGEKQVLIWTQYRFEAVRIAEMLTAKGRSYGVCNGSVPQEKQDTVIDGFKSGNLQYLIGHPASIGVGHTFVNCSYAVYFSRSYSYMEQYQSQDRIYRKGQKNACTYYFIDAENSIDGIIRAALDTKEELNEVFIAAMKGE